MHCLLFVNGVLKRSRNQAARGQFANCQIGISLQIERWIVSGVHIGKALRHLIKRGVKKRDVVFAVCGS